MKLGAMEARRLRVGFREEGEPSARRAIFSLKEELESMSEGEAEALGKSIFSALKVKSAKESDSPILKG